MQKYVSKRVLTLADQLVLDWELPLRLLGQNVMEWMLLRGASILEDRIVHSDRLDYQVAKLYRSVSYPL